MISAVRYQRIADGIVELAHKMESMLEKEKVKSFQT